MEVTFSYYCQTCGFEYKSNKRIDAPFTYPHADKRIIDKAKEEGGFELVQRCTGELFHKHFEEGKREMQVWHIPQIPMKPFIVEVDSIEQALFVINVLVEYDLFQYENNIKPDYSNGFGLQVFEPYFDEFIEWEDEDGYTISDYFDNGGVKPWK